MYKTTDSQHLKQKKEDMWVLHWNYYTRANSHLLQILISDMPVVEASIFFWMLAPATENAVAGHIQPVGL